jgi:hypothetical protein
VKEIPREHHKIVPYLSQIFQVKKGIGPLFPAYEDELGLRLGHSKELYELLGGPDLVKFIKFERLHWAGHIVQMDNSRIPKKVLDGKLHGRRPVGK